MLSLPLLIPAFELVVCFGTQAAMVFLVLAIRSGFTEWRNRRFTANQKPNSPTSEDLRVPQRFSLQTLLLAIVVFASIIGVAIRLPKLEWTAWMIVFGLGFQAALQTLMAAWLLLGRSSKWLRVPLAGLVPVLTLLALILMFNSIFDLSSTRPDPLGESVSHLLQLDGVMQYFPEGIVDWMKWSFILGVC